MKTIPPPCPEPETGPKYWRSLDELSETPQFREWVEREFPAGASEFTDPVSRRNFVKLMSASFLLAGLGWTGCRRPVEQIQPFAKMPEGYTHGVPSHFATARPIRGSAIPLVVKSHEGRPIKIEGNAAHPDSNGGTDTFTQAAILDLYDVDRAQNYLQGGNAVTPQAALVHLAEVSKTFAARGGEGLCFLAGRSSSPSVRRLQQVLLTQFPKARWFTYEAVDFGIHAEAATLVRGGARDAGSPVLQGQLKPRWRLDKADIVVSLDCDFMGGEEDVHLSIRDFTQRRKIEKPADTMNRLYAVEALMSLTGANADHRLRVPASRVIQVAAALAAEVLGKAGGPGAALASQAAALGLPAGVDPKWIQECAKDLLAHKGHAVVLAGHGQPLAVHLLVNAINSAIDADGATIELRPSSEPVAGTLTELVQILTAGQVDTLVVLGGNPAYNAPADLAWSQAQAKAKTVIRLGYYVDETSAGATWHLPETHFLESWGDAVTADGTYVSIQPLTAPLFKGMTEIELLARLAGEVAPSAYEIVRETFRARAGAGEFEEQWKQLLHDGFQSGGAVAPVQAPVNWAALAQRLGPELRAAGSTLAVVPAKDALEVVFHRDLRVDDGRFVNNGWLQEMPDPITKMVWENVIVMSQATAQALGLTIKDHEDSNLHVPLVEISIDGRKVEGPAWIQPGLADNVVGLALGYGQAKAGRIGRGTGYDAHAIRTSARPHFAVGAKVTDTGRLHPLSTTQNHWAMEGRPLVREANLEQFRANPSFAKGMNLHEPPGPRDAQGRPLPLYDNPLDIPDRTGVRPRDKSPHAWGMTVDLGACVGCSACMMACQSENNVPIVGKDLVNRNREMHWIRIDRYYAGSVADPQVLSQPMFCQHCESAPCESVCPVNATAHDEEGINVMAYNRCVGTRYCSNNCPYKVRRFNYLDYNKRPLEKLKGPFYSSPMVNRTDGEWDLLRWFKNPDRGLRPDDEWELLKLAKNPDVTVRMRGVMEKCTFCIQRIEQAKITQKVKARDSGDIEVRDGVIKTACEQACPAGAIVFGNINDPNSRVSKLKKLERDYLVLEFLATKPRTSYLARIRNPNPAMPDYRAKPESLREWEAQGNSLQTHGQHGDGHGASPAHGAETKGGH